LFANECPWAALCRARSLALLMEAELHFVRVVAPLPRPRRLFSKAETADVLGALKRILEAKRATRAWLTGALGHEFPRGRLKLRGGEFFDQVAARASELEVDLVVVPPMPGPTGRKVTWLARTAGTPVLVARAATSREAVVAGTDLCEEGGDAVLRSAANLCRRLDAPMVAVHNLTPVTVPAGPDMPMPVALPVQREVAQSRMQRLIEAARALGVDAETVLASQVDPAEVILGEARARDADMIVVGTRRRGWLERLTGRSVAARVLDQARRSVLVTPLRVEAGSTPGALRRHLHEVFAQGHSPQRKDGTEAVA
jgi:universal stress protein E